MLMAKNTEITAKLLSYPV